MGVKLKMKSFVAVLACLSAASAAVLPAGVVGSYAYPHAYGYTAAAPVAYAGQPIAYNTAPAAVLGGVYGAAYDPSVAYANLYPVAEPYVHEDIAAEPYVDAQIEAEPYVHEEIAAEPYVHAEIPAEAYVHAEIPLRLTSTRSPLLSPPQLSLPPLLSLTTTPLPPWPPTTTPLLPWLPTTTPPLPWLPTTTPPL